MKSPESPSENTSSSLHGFETFSEDNGKHHFRFIDDVGQIIFISKGYQSKKSRDNGVQVAIRNVQSDENFEKKKNKQHKHFFILKARNHKTIGKSILFGSEKKMKEKMALFQSIEQDAPIFGQWERKITATPTPKKQKVEKEALTTTSSQKHSASKVVTKLEAGKSEVMPRYKFTVIYYPDSGIWMVKNDFSGESKQLKTFDCEKVQHFFKEQLPREEQEAMPSSPAPTASATPKKPSPKVKKEKFQEVKLNIQTHSGQPIRQMGESKKLGLVEVVSQKNDLLHTHSYDAQLLAKSIDGNKVFVIGQIYQQNPWDGRLLIPILGGDRLKPGAYLFTVKVDQGKNTDEAAKYVGRQMIMLN